MKTQTFECIVEYSRTPYSHLIVLFPGLVEDDFKKEKFFMHPDCMLAKRVAHIETFHLVRLDSMLTAFDALNFLFESGYRPALFEELISAARHDPTLGKRFPVLALGAYTVVKKQDIYPCVSSIGRSRARSLETVNHDIHDGFRLLAIKTQ